MAQSSEAAASYLSDLLNQREGNLDEAISSYNWGPGNLSRQGIENAPQETVDYLEKVKSFLGQQNEPERNPNVLEEILAIGDRSLGLPRKKEPFVKPPSSAYGVPFPEKKSGENLLEKMRRVALEAGSNAATAPFNILGNVARSATEPRFTVEELLNPETAKTLDTPQKQKAYFEQQGSLLEQGQKLQEEKRKLQEEIILDTPEEKAEKAKESKPVSKEPVIEYKKPQEKQKRGVNMPLLLAGAAMMSSKGDAFDAISEGIQAYAKTSMGEEDRAATKSQQDFENQIAQEEIDIARSKVAAYEKQIEKMGAPKESIAKLKADIAQRS
jgi:hypothetical protein